jgi:hypothetical protein
MGQIWKPNQAFSTYLLLEVLKQIDNRIENSSSSRDVNRRTPLHTLSVVSYLIPRVSCLETHMEKGKEYLIVALRGKIKGAHEQWEHLLPCSPITSTGVDINASIDRLIKLKETQDRMSGPAISDEAGAIFSSQVMDDALHGVLEELFVNKGSLFPPTIENIDDLRKRYQVFRSFRQSSDTRALDQQVATTNIDIITAVQQSKKQRAGGPATRWGTTMLPSLC